MINRLPWRKKLRTSAANNLDKINEIVDYINHSDISPVMLSEHGSGRSVTVGVSSSLKSLDVYGESIQDGTPTPDAPVDVQVVEAQDGGQFGILTGDTVTPIDLQGHVLASLPAGASVLTSGARDVLSIDSAGHKTANMETGIAVFDGSEDEGWGISSTFGNQPYTTSIGNAILKPPTTGRVVPMLCNRLTAVSAAFITNGTVGVGVTATGTIVVRMGSGDADLTAFKADLAANPLVIIYPLATPQLIDLGYIDMPTIESGDAISVSATITPVIDVSWWCYDDITDIIRDMKAYTDWKVSQAEGASTLGNNRLGSFPMMKETVENGKIEDGKIEDEEVSEEIEDTEVE